MADSSGDGGSSTPDCYVDALLPRAYDIERLAKKKHREVLDHLGYDSKPGEENKLFGWIPEAYRRWTGLPDPMDFNRLADAMDPVFKVMGISRIRDGVNQPAERTIQQGISGASNCFDSWQGDAKKYFTDFSEGWSVHLSNQGNVAVALQEAMDGTARFFEAARADIQTIADQTVTALEAVGCGASDVKVVFTVASALAGVAAAMAAPGAGVIVLASISAGSGAVGNLVPDEKEMPLGASTAKGVIDNMADAMSTLARWVDAQERAVVGVLKENLDTVTANRPGYVPAAPQVTPPPGGITPGWLKPT